MLLNNGEDWQPEDEDVLKWQKLYPAVDVHQELNAMDGWCDANPSKRKTPRGIKKFVNSWLARAQDKGGSPMAKAARSGKIEKTRDMSTLDDLTHVFVDAPGIREHFLEKFGQYFENGIRHEKKDGA